MTAGQSLAPCGRCKKRPRKSKRDRYCAECKREYMQQWRAGWIEVRISPEEYEMILAIRRCQAALSALE